MNTGKTWRQLTARRVVPLVVVDDAAESDVLADALVAGGLPVVEVTLRTSAALETIRRIATRGDVLVGAGTVTTARQVDEAISAGAQFIVSPGTSAAVVERCRDLAIEVLPGAVTATELLRIVDLGLTTVKFFPASTSGGAAAIAALAKAFPDVRFVPTGGVEPATMSTYLALPSVIAVGGSWMLPRDRVSARDVDGLSRLVAEAVSRARPDSITMDAGRLRD